MKVKCVTLKGSSAPKSLLQLGHNQQSEFPLLIGETYEVYAICAWEEKILYLVSLESIGPILAPAELFEITDSKLSKYWYFGVNRDTAYSLTHIWGYQEFANDSDHYYQLLERYESAIEIFMQRKEIMDREYPSSSVQIAAERGDDEWLLCPICSNAWQSQSSDAIVKCPNCASLLKNPRFG